MTSALASLQAKNKLLCTARICLNFAIAIHLVPAPQRKQTALLLLLLLLLLLILGQLKQLKQQGELCELSHSYSKHYFLW